jgi:diadenosine tetraphosphate (Ap4A) HIT family hydrolase
VPSSSDERLDRVVDCMACKLSSGELALPGGRIFRTRFWLVEHCIGPLGLGTLIVKPERHLTSVADLSDDETAELGPLLRRASRVASRLVETDQVYNCLWSHAGGERVHIHYVVQPVTKEQMSAFAAHGPNLQVAMFSAGSTPEPADVERVSNLARRFFSDESHRSASRAMNGGSPLRFLGDPPFDKPTDRGAPRK